MESNPRDFGAKSRVARNLESWRVEIFDGDAVRCGLISRLVLAEGALVAQTDSECSPGLPPHVSVVAVPLDVTLVERALQHIRHCQALGVQVLAYGPGTDAWPVAQKCRSLIAGALQLLDVESGRFDTLFRGALGGILAGLSERAAENAHVRARLRSLGVEGVSRGMLEVCRQLLRFAALSDLPVLVTGETGTGKERITRALHQCDPKRATGPLVAVNCGALVSTLAESELFGHRRGAFTGAERSRPGLVRAADKGILFLDEIGELDLSLQTKLLRVLQEGKVLGVGDEEEVTVNVRVVAATHRDLRELVAAGKFRADLFHRLRVLPLHLPPLRERPEDLPVLVDYFLARKRGVVHSLQHTASKEFVDALRMLPLPGNVRQLENILQQTLVNKKDSGPLVLADLPAEILMELAANGSSTTGSDENAGGDRRGLVSHLQSAMVELAEAHDWKLDHCLRVCEREVVAAALSRTRGNQTRMAGMLGVTVRCIYNKLRKLGLNAHRLPSKVRPAD